MDACVACGQYLVPGDVYMIERRFPVYEGYSRSRPKYHSRSWRAACKPCATATALADGYSRWLPVRCEGCDGQLRFPGYSRWSSLPGIRPHWCTKACRRATLTARARRARKGRPAPRPCKVCGTTFSPSRDDARFCSGRCRQANFQGRRIAPKPSE